MDLKTDYWRYYNSASAIDIVYERHGKATKVKASITICGLTHSSMHLDTIGDPMMSRQLSLEAACERFYENIVRSNGGYAMVEDRLKHARRPSMTHIHPIYGVLNFYDKVEEEQFKYMDNCTHVPPLVMYKLGGRWFSYVEAKPESAAEGFQWFVEIAQNKAVEYFQLDADNSEDGRDRLSDPLLLPLRLQIRHCHGLLTRFWGNRDYAEEAKNVDAKQWRPEVKQGMEVIVKALAPVASFILDHYEDMTIDQMALMVAKRGVVFIYGEDKKLAFNMSGYELKFDARGDKIPLSPIL